MASSGESLTAKDYLVSVIGLIGVIVGGFTTYLATCRMKSKELKTERKTLTLAFYGEITGLEATIKNSTYYDVFEAVIKDFQGKPLPRIFASIKRNYFKVYDANVNRIGLLKPPLNEWIATYYTLGNLIFEYIDLIAGPDFCGINPQEQFTLAQKSLALMNTTRGLGKQILDEISRQYPDVKHPDSKTTPEEL